MAYMGGPPYPDSMYSYSQTRQNQRREQLTRDFAASQRPGSWKTSMFFALFIVVFVVVGLLVAYFH
jgi:hypothetical protein